MNDEKGFMGLTLSQIGLFIATGVLLAAVFGFIYYNDWGRTAELENIASGLHGQVNIADNCFFENISRWNPPEKSFTYTISVSTEYLSVKTDEGHMKKDLVVVERFLTPVLPRDDSNEWKTGEEMHNFLKGEKGHKGSEKNPIPGSDENSIKNYFTEEIKTCEEKYAMNPLKIDLSKTVFIEKVYIYFDIDMDGIWSPNIDIREELLLLYQN
ncbi:MAG: hypothetical protein V5A64_03410 [Candidatus Thermoplasmatota archaeon]